MNDTDARLSHPWLRINRALLETGRKKNPGVAIIQKIARALDVPVGRLLE